MGGVHSKAKRCGCMGDESSKDSEVDTTRKGIKSTPRQQASYRTNESNKEYKSESHNSLISIKERSSSQCITKVQKIPENIEVQRLIESDLASQKQERQHYLDTREQERDPARRFTFSGPTHDRLCFLTASEHPN